MTGGYLETLSENLRAYGVDKPVVVVDLDRLDANCALAVKGTDAHLDRRLVAKSLPCLPLLDHIRKLIPTSGLMTFSEPMLLALLQAEPETDHLIGKPLPVSSRRAYSGHLSRCCPACSVVDRHTGTPARLPCTRCRHTCTSALVP